MKNDERCKGGWYYGSISRGSEDVYSDYDPVKDIFKLIKNVDLLFHCDVDLLLNQYDNLDWGAWESKVKNCVPIDKQEHLKTNFTRADFSDLEVAIKKSMILFKQDSEEICTIKGIAYPETISE